MTTNKTHLIQLVNSDSAANALLLPEEWQSFPGETPQDAIAEAIKRRRCKFHGYGFKQATCPDCFPCLAYVALGTHRHPNGAPIAVQEYRLSTKPPQRCPNDCGPLEFYDGALGYEALRCASCGYELDLNLDANAKSAGELALRDALRFAQKQLVVRTETFSPAVKNLECRLCGARSDAATIPAAAAWITNHGCTYGRPPTFPSILQSAEDQRRRELNDAQ